MGWVCRRGANPRYPKLEVEGWWCFARHRVRIEAPLELVLDNFIEVEHTPTTHLVLGYALDAMPEVRRPTKPTTVAATAPTAASSSRSISGLTL